MVHRKSTYKLMFKNYTPVVRRNVWQENANIREQRKFEESLHHSIYECEDECDCDGKTTSEDDDDDDDNDHREIKHTITKQDQQSVNQSSILKEKSTTPPPTVPRLRFSPDITPRNTNIDSDNENQDRSYGSSVIQYKEENKPAMKTKVPSRSNTQLHNIHKEYDLIPATSLKDTIRLQPRRPLLKKSSILLRSRNCPITSKLSRTTMTNYCDRNKSPPFVPIGTCSYVRNIGDNTSYNAYLAKNKVHKTALNARHKRQEEIEELVKAQRKLTLDDWRKKHRLSGNINHSSLFSSDGAPHLSSNTRRPRRYTSSAPARIQLSSKYCRSCGCRK